MINFYHFIASFLLALIITPFIRFVSIKTDKVADVKVDRWHSEPKALFGGTAIWAAWIIVCLPYIEEKGMMLIMTGASAIFILGLIDDLFGLQPQIKLIGQVIIAASLVPFGLTIEIIPYPVISIPLTIFWMVGITNAFNLLDNMDGLSSGVSIISAICIGILLSANGNSNIAIAAFGLAGASLGFLRYNFHPASIFMGDCGSLFLGFVLACLTITGTWVHASSLVTTMAVPLLILGIPIFDTTFVALNRKINGQPISRGGKDHISHSLVSMGLSEKKAVTLLYGFSACLGAVPIYFNHINPLLFVLISIFFAIVLYCIGTFLSDSTAISAPQRLIVKRSVKTAGILSKRRIVEILIDIVLISAAYYIAYLLRYEGVVAKEDMILLTKSLPYIIIVKLFVFSYMGLYRSIWKYVGIHDAVDIVKAVILSSFVIITSILMSPSRFSGYSRAVFIIDSILTIIFVGGTRFMMLVFREFLASLRLRGKRILIIGAGDAGAMVLKEIKNNNSIDYYAVGFIDDDEKKHHTSIHGVPVLGGTADMVEVARKYGVGEVVIAIPSAGRERISRITQILREANIKYGTFPIVKKLLDRIGDNRRGLSRIINKQLNYN